MKSVGVLLLFAFFFLPNVAFAHVLKTNGPIGAVFHVSPDDDPIAGEPSDFFFEFKDKENKFSPTDCNCTVTITQNGEELFVSPLTAHTDDPNLESASFSFTFPQKNIYTIMIKGEPLTAGAFTPFSLTYDLRVERESGVIKGNTTSPVSETRIYLIGGAIIGSILLYLIINRFKKTHHGA